MANAELSETPTSRDGKACAFQSRGSRADRRSALIEIYIFSSEYCQVFLSYFCCLRLPFRSVQGRSICTHHIRFIQKLSRNFPEQIFYRATQ